MLGAAGQIGTDLVTTLRETYGGDRVIATDVKEQTGYLAESGPFYVLDVLDAQAVADIIRTNKVKEVYLLAALLSATAEQKMKTAWKIWPGFSGNTVGNIKISTPFTLSFQTKKWL